MLDSRFTMWLGKFAFPKVNTKKTSLQIVNKAYHTIHTPTQKENGTGFEVITLNKYVFNGKRRRVYLWVGYSEANDALFVMDGTPAEW